MVAAREPTIGMWLKQAGYATACYGKWNVGEVKDVSWPGAHGFDDWLIIDHNTGYFQHQNKNKDCQGREMLFGTGGKRVTTLRGKYLTDIWTDKALEFIDANAAKPFFLYLPFAVPHSPLQDPADPSLAFDEQPKAATPAAREAFVKMVEYLDSRIAKIFQALEKRGLTDNTLVMFTSDNGGMRSGNCWPLEASRSNGSRKAGSVCRVSCNGRRDPAGDGQYATVDHDGRLGDHACRGRCPETCPPGRKLDGIDLLPILQGKATPIQIVYWVGGGATGARTSTPCGRRHTASGDWKLLRTYKHVGGNKRSAEHTDELFNLPSPAHKLDGNSLLPLLKNPDADWDKPTRMSHEADGIRYDVVMDNNYRMTRLITGETELYKLADDPHEFNNLARIPNTLRSSSVWRSI